jgi:hypothetical protein
MCGIMAASREVGIFVHHHRAAVLLNPISLDKKLVSAVRRLCGLENKW